MQDVDFPQDVLSQEINLYDYIIVSDEFFMVNIPSDIMNFLSVEDTDYLVSLTENIACDEFLFS